MGTTDTVAAFKSKIAPELQPLARPIADCQPHPDNARKHKLPRIAKSLNDHGQRSPIVVQASTGFIVKGNGTWTAAAQILGWSEIAQVWQDMDDEAAMAYLLADNKASDEAEYDNVKLAKALQKMADGPGLMDSLWDNEELEDLVEFIGGPVLLQGTGAEYADAGTEAGERRLEKAAAPGAKRKEIVMLLEPQAHVEFSGWVQSLKARWNIGGAVLTIYEAVKRQAAAEEGAETLGRDLSVEQIARAKRDVIVEVRSILLSDPRYEQPSRVQVLALLESAAPQVVSPRRQAEVVIGQTEAFSAPEAQAEPAPDAKPADDDAEQAAALARYRAAQAKS